MYLLYCLFSTKLLIISQRWSPLQKKDYIGPNGKTLLISPQNLHRRLNPNCTGTVVVLIVWYFDLLLPMQAVTITTNVVSSNPAQTKCTRYYVIKFVSDFRQVGGLLRVLRFRPSRYNNITLTQIKTAHQWSWHSKHIICRFVQPGKWYWFRWASIVYNDFLQFNLLWNHYR